ncbi:unnamed protein product [Durusdinium trenchii]|uniref:Uncharacterized protein n=1 Tax=Durusdinium trenchii TaxID=1381693 RepID=A0ABP0RES3_9DINO
MSFKLVGGMFGLVMLLLALLMFRRAGWLLGDAREDIQRAFGWNTSQVQSLSLAFASTSSMSSTSSTSTSTTSFDLPRKGLRPLRPLTTPQTPQTPQPLQVTLSHCKDSSSQRDFASYIIREAGFEPSMTVLVRSAWRSKVRKTPGQPVEHRECSVVHGPKVDASYKTCGRATDLVILCDGKVGDLKQHIGRCEPNTLFKGSRKVAYHPRLEELGSKSGLCKISNLASELRGVEFRVVPECFSAPHGILNQSVQALARQSGGEQSMWVGKKNFETMGTGIFFLTVQDLSQVEQFKVHTLQRAVMKVPLWHERRVEVRHWFAVTSMDPPRVYVCVGHVMYKTTGLPSIPEDQLRSMTVTQRRPALISNAQMKPGSNREFQRFFGSANDLRDVLAKQGLDTGMIADQVAEKITRGFLAAHNKTSCHNKEQPYNCEEHMAFGVADSVIDLERREPFVLELMFVQEDWMFRGEGWNANSLAKEAIRQLTTISLAPLKHSAEEEALLKSASSSFLATLQKDALNAARSMWAEAKAASMPGMSCPCLVCLKPEMFSAYFPEGNTSESFGHPWMAFYDLYQRGTLPT